MSSIALLAFALFWALLPAPGDEPARAHRGMLRRSLERLRWAGPVKPGAAKEI